MEGGGRRDQIAVTGPRGTFVAIRQGAPSGQEGTAATIGYCDEPYLSSNDFRLYSLD